MSHIVRSERTSRLPACLICILPLRALASILICASLICLVSVLLVEHSPYFFVLSSITSSVAFSSVSVFLLPCSRPSNNVRKSVGEFLWTLCINF